MLLPAPAASFREASGCDPGPLPKEPIERVSTERAQVSITFDELTPLNARILRIFDRFRMRGTFFITGRQALDRPSDAREILAHGHELANHSRAHRNLTLQPAGAYEDLQTANRQIRRVTGFRPCAFRPPFFAYDERTTRAARALGMSSVLAIRGNDMFTADSDAVVDHALEGVRPGDIILLHQIEHSVRALPRILAGLRARGLRSVPVLRMLGGSWVN